MRRCPLPLASGIYMCRLQLPPCTFAFIPTFSFTISQLSLKQSFLLGEGRPVYRKRGRKRAAIASPCLSFVLVGLRLALLCFLFLLSASYFFLCSFFFFFDLLLPSFYWLFYLFYYYFLARLSLLSPSRQLWLRHIGTSICADIKASKEESSSPPRALGTACAICKEPQHYLAATAIVQLSCFSPLWLLFAIHLRHALVGSFFFLHFLLLSLLCVRGFTDLSEGLGFLSLLRVGCKKDLVKRQKKKKREEEQKRARVAGSQTEKKKGSFFYSFLLGVATHRLYIVIVLHTHTPRPLRRCLS